MSFLFDFCFPKETRDLGEIIYTPTQKGGGNITSHVKKKKEGSSDFLFVNKKNTKNMNIYRHVCIIYLWSTTVVYII